MRTQFGNVYMATYYELRGAYFRSSVMNVCPDALKREPEAFIAPHVSTQGRHIWILQYLIGAQQMPHLEEHFDTMFRQHHPHAILVELHHRYINDA